MMQWTILLALFMPAAFTVAAGPVLRTKSTTPAPASFADDLTPYLKGFNNPSIQSSVGGKAICISGTVAVTASATNYRVNMEQPANQTVLTEFLLETLINSTSAEKYVIGKTNVTGNYGIYSQLCFPATTGTINATTIHFLIHGAGFDRSYWDPAPGYSYIDYAAEQGYSTFTYDRLGTGLSDHPDPIQIVQVPLQIAIAHELIQLLRTGGLASQTFNHVIGIGHSLGSTQLNGVTAQYPNDVDAAVLTGFATESYGLVIAFSSVDGSIASQNQPLRFSDLPSGYILISSIQGNQFFFFRAPTFDPALLDLAENTKQTLSIGEFLSLSGLQVANGFTGPIDVVNGENDLPNCGGDCLVPFNKAAAVKDALYPAASNASSWYILPSTGHGINLHYTATEAYEHIVDFVRMNGF